jgi:hypothetical protein
MNWIFDVEDVGDADCRKFAGLVTPVGPFWDTTNKSSTAVNVCDD